MQFGRDGYHGRMSVESGVSFASLAAAVREATYRHLVRIWFDGASAEERAALLRTCLHEPDDLVREFLVRELRLAGSAAFHRIVLETAERLEASGEAEEAVAMLVETGDAEALRALLARRGRDLARVGAFDTLERALRAIPDGMCRTDSVCVRLLDEIRAARDGRRRGAARQGHPAGDGSASPNDDGEHRPDGFTHPPRHRSHSRFRCTI